MSELVLKKTQTNNILFQLMSELADMVSYKVAEKLQETGEFFNKTITVEAETIKDENPDELLTIKEVCEIFKVKRGALYYWRDKGILKPDTHIGRSPRYKMASINDFINNVQSKN